MTLADHTTPNAQSTDGDINTTVDLTQLQLNWCQMSIRLICGVNLVDR